MKISSVDSARGKEKKIVIVNTVRLGGAQGLGFVADLKRQSVALSQAKDGLIIIGNEGLGWIRNNDDQDTQSAPSKA